MIQNNNFYIRQHIRSLEYPIIGQMNQIIISLRQFSGISQLHPMNANAPCCSPISHAMIRMLPMKMAACACYVAAWDSSVFSTVSSVSLDSPFSSFEAAILSVSLISGSRGK